MFPLNMNDSLLRSQKNFEIDVQNRNIISLISLHEAYETDINYEILKKVMV